MSSNNQIEANRRNAKKSTGPRTPEGKSASRLNALQHGIFAIDPILPGEDPAHFDALRASHYDLFHPVGAAEQILVAALVRNAWRLERCSNAETALGTWGFERHSQSDHSLARSESWNAKDFSQLQRRIDSAERNYRRDIELLLKLQTARQKGVRAAPPAPQPKPFQPLVPDIGFVVRRDKPA